MRRILAPFLVVCLVAACGGETTETDPQTAAPTTSETVAPTAAAPPDTTVTTQAPPPDTTVAPADTTTTAAATTTTVPEPMPPSGPLTGLEVDNPDLIERRVMAVKVDNHWDARPQTGIGEAETVFELLVEGGLTRFIALFHTVDPEAVGPVRSVRPTDPHLLRHFNATLLTSGGQNWVLRMFPQNGVGVISEIGVGGYRDSSRSAPHNYYVRPSELRAVADERLYPNTAPAPLWQFGELPAAAVMGAVYEVQMEWAPDNIITWRWNGVGWERILSDGPHLRTSPEGVDRVITADNLVVLFTGLFYTKPPSGSGYALPTMETTGEGRALVFSRGQVASGRWERADTTGSFALSLPDGSPLTVPPGRSWISLFPEGRPVTW